MISDDTEHTVFVADSLLEASDDPDRFQRRLAGRLRRWLLFLPAGVGFATLRACLKLWTGFPPSKSGVFSAGNGPAMRVSPVGARFYDSAEQRIAFTKAAARITHTDPKAAAGALAVAEIIAWVLRETPTEPPAVNRLVSLLTAGETDDEWAAIVDTLARSLAAGEETAVFAGALGLTGGIGGYVYHTVPTAVHAWHRGFGDFESTLSTVIGLGGDTDTTGAIAGAMAGAVLGEAGIVREWIEGIRDFPRGPAHLRRLANRLYKAATTDENPGPLPAAWPLIPLRNSMFLTIVLGHGFRRLFPPY
jgi:ADP-ribosylglycohydrolase